MQCCAWLQHATSFCLAGTDTKDLALCWEQLDAALSAQMTEMITLASPALNHCYQQLRQMACEATERRAEYRCACYHSSLLQEIT